MLSEGKPGQDNVFMLRGGMFISCVPLTSAIALTSTQVSLPCSWIERRTSGQVSSANLTA